MNRLWNGHMTRNHMEKTTATIHPKIVVYVTVKKIKCNNINANLNGDIEVGASPALSALATKHKEQMKVQIGANSGNDGRGGDGRPSGDDSNSRFICINNNDNTVVEGEEPDLACEECFAANSNLQTAIEDFLVDFDGITIDAGPFGIFCTRTRYRYHRTIM